MLKKDVESIKQKKENFEHIITFITNKLNLMEINQVFSYEFIELDKTLNKYTDYTFDEFLEVIDMLVSFDSSYVKDLKDPLFGTDFQMFNLSYRTENDNKFFNVKYFEDSLEFKAIREVNSVKFLDLQYIYSLLEFDILLRK